MIRLRGAIVVCFGLALASAALAVESPSLGAPASQASTVTPLESITSSEDVIDPDFRFSTKALAVERRVEMRQWQRDASGHYAPQWSAAQIDSTTFDKAHANPAQLPFNGARWWTHAAQLQGHDVAASVLGNLQGWQPFAPDLRQLPVNLAASFQPDGAWLSTSQDPAQPVVGDVRLQWQVLKQAAPPTGIVLRDGEWRMADQTVAVTQPPTPVEVTTPSASSRPQHLFGSYLPWLLGAGMVLALLILLARRRRRR